MAIIKKIIHKCYGERETLIHAGEIINMCAATMEVSMGISQKQKIEYNPAILYLGRTPSQQTLEILAFLQLTYSRQFGSGTNIDVHQLMSE